MVSRTKLGHGQSKFFGLGAEETAGEADNIAQIQLFKEGIGLGADFLTLDVALQAAALVLEMKKGGLAELPHQHQAAGQTEGLVEALEFVMAGLAIALQKFGDVVLRLESVGKRLNPGFPQSLNFFPALPDDGGLFLHN